MNVQRLAAASRPEERFIEIFQEVFGPAAAAKLEPQVHFRDIGGRDRYIDFALDSLFDRYALEIDGETYHHPTALTPEDYEEQLLRQNSLIHQGWRVLRWTDRQIATKPDEVKEHLIILLDQAIRLTVPHEYLPTKRGSLIDLHEHQAEALENLREFRERGEQIALLSHAVGTGKTTTAVEDARAFGGRTLFLAHTQELVEQALERFAELWPEVSRARLGTPDDEVAHIVVGTVQYMGANLNRFAQRAFDYLVIDEAHHATARSYRAVLRYFDPEFLLGLTGTPDRTDGQNALDVFRNTAHRMDMKTAVEQSILCDIRAFRVQTNVDLRRVRFNGSVYNQKDMESRVFVPERNHLIVETYQENVPNRPAVVFCVSVNHAETMAQLFTDAGFPAKAVSGRMNKQERQDALSQYDAGTLRILCACDVLNEGWDAPHTEVLLMARPTLSRVIYQQQIGRGMRTHPGKKYLVLFDFVDMFGRHNEAMSVHKLVKKPKYKPGERIFGTEQDGDVAEIPLHLWASDYIPVSVFDWQERIEGMVTAPALSSLLRKSEEWIGDKWKRGEITADEEVDLGGGRIIPYFLTCRASELRQRYTIPEVTDDNLWEDFLTFVSDMAMTKSYKPVWFLALLQNANESGRANVVAVQETFHQFYRTRADGGETPEEASSPLSRPYNCSNEEVRSAINRGPFYRFSRLGYVTYARDVAFLQIAKPLWKHLSESTNRSEVEARCHTSIYYYFNRPNFRPQNQ